MAHGNGKVFTKAETVVIGVSSFDHLQSGNHVRVLGDKYLSRFVRDDKGNTFIVSSPKGSRVSMAAFRLACGKPKPNVVRAVK